MTTLSDFALVWEKAQRDESGQKLHEIVRVVLHPEDFRELQKAAEYHAFTERVSAGFAKGTLWGIPIHEDPRGEKGIAYVVTKSLGEAKGLRGNRIALDGRQIYFDVVQRRTAWSRLLDDDPV